MDGFFEGEAYGLADLLRGGGGEVVVGEGFAHTGPDAFKRGGQGAVEVEDDGFDWHVRRLDQENKDVKTSNGDIFCLRFLDRFYEISRCCGGLR